MAVLQLLKKSGLLEFVIIPPVIFIFLYFQSCSLIADIVSDCLDADGPEFDVHTLPWATLDKDYKTIIKAYIVNEPDNDYFYHFDFEGELPRGIYRAKDEDKHIVTIWGVPKEKGIFVFTLTVDVTYKYSMENNGSYDDGNPLCYTYNSQKYSLEVK